MAYNLNTDYAAKMQELVKNGVSTSDPRYKSLEQSRAEKIAAATPQQKSSWGVNDTSQYVAAPVSAPVPDYVRDSMNRSGYTPVVTPDSYPSNPNQKMTAIQYPVQQPDPLADQKKQLQALMDAVSNMYNPQQQADDVRRQFESTKTSNIAELRAAYDKARSELSAQNPAIQQNARNSLNANDTFYYTQGLPQLRAAMEAAGNYGGGEMLGQNVNLISMRGQNASNIEQQKTDQLQALQDAIAQLNTEQPNKEAALASSLDAQSLAAQLQAANQGIQNQLSAASLASQNLQSQQQFDADQTYRAWQQRMAEDEAAWARSSSNPSVAAQILSNEAASINLQYLPQQLKTELQRIQQDIANGRLTTQSQLEETRARIKQIGESTAQGWAQIGNELANQQYQQGQYATNRATQAYNDAVSQIDNSMYVSVSPVDGRISVTNPTGLRSYILSLNLSDAQTDQLLLRYGLRVGSPTTDYTSNATRANGGSLY